MINVTLILSGKGLVRSCRLEGHSGAGKKGADIVCAAVSVLIRTVVRTMEGHEGVVFNGTAPEPGSAGFTLDSYGENEECWLRGLGDCLLTGLLDIQEEYPKHCRIECFREDFKE